MTVATLLVHGACALFASFLGTPWQDSPFAKQLHVPFGTAEPSLAFHPEVSHIWN